MTKDPAVRRSSPRGLTVGATATLLMLHVVLFLAIPWPLESAYPPERGMTLLRQLGIAFAFGMLLGAIVSVALVAIVSEQMRELGPPPRTLVLCGTLLVVVSSLFFFKLSHFSDHTSNYIYMDVPLKVHAIISCGVGTSLLVLGIGAYLAGFRVKRGVGDSGKAGQGLRL